VRSEPSLSDEVLANLDVEFHETLAALLCNKTFNAQLKQINARLFVFRLIDFGKPDRVIAGCKEHLKVLSALAAGGVQGSCEALTANIDGARSTARLASMEALRVPLLMYEGSIT
jgi:DNA-binding GntR family transcriptional regulator